MRYIDPADTLYSTPAEALAAEASGFTPAKRSKGIGCQIFSYKLCCGRLRGGCPEVGRLTERVEVEHDRRQCGRRSCVRKTENQTFVFQGPEETETCRSVSRETISGLRYPKGQ